MKQSVHEWKHKYRKWRLHAECTEISLAFSGVVDIKGVGSQQNGRIKAVSLSHGLLKFVQRLS